MDLNKVSVFIKNGKLGNALLSIILIVTRNQQIGHTLGF